MEPEEKRKKLPLTLSETVKAFQRGAVKETEEYADAEPIHKDDVAAGNYVRDVPTDD